MTGMRTFFRFLLACSLFQGTGEANNPTDLHLDCISSDDGLSHNTVLCVLQDRRGFMWFGTQQGLNRYDGYRFQVFRHTETGPASLSHDHIWALQEDEAGVLWVGSDHGLNRWNAEQNTFTRYYPEPGHPGRNSIRTIFEDSQHQFWVGTGGGGLFRFDRAAETFRPFGEQPAAERDNGGITVNGLCECVPGTMWMATLSGLFQIDMAADTTLPLPGAMQRAGLDRQPVYAVMRDHEGDLWIGTARGLYRASPGKGLPPGRYETELHQYTLPMDITAARIAPVSALYEDELGQLWVGTLGGGIYRYLHESDSFVRYRPCKCLKDTGGLSSSWIHTIFKNRSGTYWFGTNEGIGKFTISQSLFSKFEPKPGDPRALCQGEIKALCEDRFGDIWIGTWGSGICKLDPRTGNFTHYRHDPQDPFSPGSDRVFSILEDRAGTIWIGTEGNGGLYRFERETEHFQHFQVSASGSLGEELISTLFEDQAGDLWIGTAGDGLGRYDRLTGTFQSYRHDPKDAHSLSNNHIYTLFQDRSGNLWVGTANQLNRFDRRTGRFERFGIRKAGADSLPGSEIYAVFQDHNGRMWIGTEIGLAEMQLISSGEITFRNIPEQEGLAATAVFGILEDARGVLWLQTQKGLTSYHPHTQVVRHYTTEDGCVKFTKKLVGGSNAYLKNRSGDMFFGGVNGLTLYSHDAGEQLRLMPPPVVLTGLEIDNRPQHIFASAPGQIPGGEAAYLDIPAGYRNLVIEFAALDFAVPQENQYAYRLEGFDPDWIYCGNQHYASYAAVPAGQYTFRVKGANHEGVWNLEGTSLAVEIVPPLWGRRWFLLLVIFLGIALFSLAHIFRVSALKRSQRAQERFSKQLIESQEEERKRIASELHDSLGQNLLIINNELMQQQQQPGETDGDLNQLSTMVREAISEVREISYNLHPHQIERLGLKKAIESAIKKIDHASKVSFSGYIDEIDDLFPESSRIHFFRIIQEALTNVYKHARATRATVEVRRFKDHLLTEISDDGSGFNPSDLEKNQHESTSLGIANMRERAMLLNGQFQIQSRPGQGTVIRVKIPLHGVWSKA